MTEWTEFELFAVCLIIGNLALGILPGYIIWSSKKHGLCNKSK